MAETDNTKLCPTCGSRLSADAKRCQVCGADLDVPEPTQKASKGLQASRIPEVTLSLPVAILLLALFLFLGAVMVFFALRQQPEIVIPPTPTNTVTITVTSSLTPTQPPPTLTNTPEPTPTPQTYYIRLGDTCLGIAAFYGVSVQSIVTLNNLPASCDTLYENQPLLIPQPTPTPTSLPSSTFSPAEQTEAACEKIEYVVQSGDTLSTISINYQVPMSAIREYNGLTGDTVFEGQPLVLPLCQRFATPGPSPTATLPPPYPAPNLLLPADGASFTAANDTVTLQWAAVGTLGETELYAMTIEDLTAGEGQKLVDYVTDTKYILPTTLRPRETTPHVFRWWVSVVRLSGADESGRPLYVSAGALSQPRVFTWSGAAAAPTPAP